MWITKKHKNGGDEMFLKTSQFKKMVKEKYNSGGIEIFRSETDTRIGGSYWMVVVKNGKINKENLAAIIEFVGELPREGTGANISRKGNQGSFTLKDIDIQAIDTDFVGISRITLTTSQDERVRLLQDDEGNIYPIYEDVLKLIDPSKIDKNLGETLPDGPFIMKDGTVMWKNNIMALKVYPRRDNNYKDLTDYLEKFPGGIV